MRGGPPRSWPATRRRPATPLRGARDPSDLSAMPVGGGDVIADPSVVREDGTPNYISRAGLSARECRQGRRLHDFDRRCMGSSHRKILSAIAIISVICGLDVAV